MNSTIFDFSLDSLNSWASIFFIVYCLIILLVIIYFILILKSLIWINRKLQYFNNAFDEYLKYTFSKGNWNNTWNL